MTISEQFWFALNNAWINCQLRLLQAKHARLVAELAELGKAPLTQSSNAAQSLLAHRIYAQMEIIRAKMQQLGYLVPSGERPKRNPLLAPRRSRRAA